MMLKDNREMRRQQNEQNRERSWLRKKSWVVCSSEKVKILNIPLAQFGPGDCEVFSMFLLIGNLV